MDLTGARRAWCRTLFMLQKKGHAYGRLTIALTKFALQPESPIDNRPRETLQPPMTPPSSLVMISVVERGRVPGPPGKVLVGFAGSPLSPGC